LQVQQLSVKFFLKEPEVIDTDQLIPIFHRWIRENALGDDLMIDVADYRHVPQGPGVMIICHEGHYAMDEGGAGIGFSYSAKRDAVGPAQERLALAFTRVLSACRQLEDEASLPGIEFDGARMQVQVMSRLAAENTVDDFRVLEGELKVFLPNLYGNASLNVLPLDADSRAPLGATVEAQSDVGVATLFERLSA
jgi:hypothetical protein